VTPRAAPAPRRATERPRPPRPAGRRRGRRRARRFSPGACAVGRERSGVHRGDERAPSIGARARHAGSPSMPGRLPLRLSPTLPRAHGRRPRPRRRAGAGNTARQGSTGAIAVRTRGPAGPVARLRARLPCVWRRCPRPFRRRPRRSARPPAQVPREDRITCLGECQAIADDYIALAMELGAPPMPDAWW
jgi:hypothetical protein